MTSPRSLSAPQLRDVFGVAVRWLELNRDALNAINVYPVPDGDTGTNMVLTLRASLGAAESADGERAGPYLRSLAGGALLGARGNSGVILSQILRGFAEALDTADGVDGAALRDALTAAALAAYEAVSEPVEGTMLTVIREAAAAASRGRERPALAEVLDAAVEEAHASVQRTPTLLPRLAEAGVVDAGGLGVAMLLAGMRFGYRGEALPAPMPAAAGAVDLSAVEHQGHGYCTEFVVLGRGLDREALRGELTALGGDSLLVVGDPGALHVHVHLADPGPALSAGATAGAVQAVKVENMQVQHEAWAAGHEPAAPAALPELGLVAVAAGPGIAAAFRDMGATQIVDGGAGANPSAGQLLEAARAAGRSHAFVLPNDPNVIMAAEQACAQAPGQITVIPSRSVPAGLGAAIAYVAGGDRDDVAAHMRDAAAAVRCVEVTRAARDTSADGVTVAQGDAIAMVDGALAARDETLEGALLKGLAGLAANAQFLTLCLGADAPPDAAERVPRLIAETCGAIEVEVIDGGQPHCPYILGVE